MDGRCAGCGGYLLPDVDTCPTCQQPVARGGLDRALLDAPLELDLPPPPSPVVASAGPAGALPGPDLDTMVPGTQDLLPEVAEPTPPPRPHGARPIDEEEVARFAAFGPAPEGPVAAVPYAIGVFRRRQELFREREGRAAGLARAEATARRALLQLGRAIVARRGDEAFVALAAPLAEVDRAAEAVEAREETLRGAREAAADALRRIAEDEAQVREALAPLEALEARRRADLDGAERDLGRANARGQRLAIELRNAERANDAEAVAAIADRRREGAKELAAAEGSRDAAARALAETQEALAPHRRRLAELEAERRSVGAAPREGTGERGAREGTPTAAHEAALVALAEAARARRLDASLGGADACASACRERDAHARAVELCSRALAAYDVGGYRTGGTVLGILGAVVLAALVAIIVR